MFAKSDTCPYCKTALGRTELTAIRRIGAGLGMYFGATA